MEPPNFELPGKVKDFVIKDKYQLVRRIDSGSFGDIYEGRELANGSPVAVKLEHMHGRPLLLYNEAQISRRLQGGVGFPEIKWSGKTNGGKFNVIVMELLGPSLEDMLNFCGRKLSLKTILMIAGKIIIIN